MITIKTPATSANIGPGFDSFGLAVDLYNTFDVEVSNTDILENVEERFQNPDNLFLKAYHRGCKAIGIEDYVHAIFHTNIPVSRGLGSSSSLIVAGIYASNALHNNPLTIDEIFQLAASIEGHPDNVAPCIFGGMTISTKASKAYITHCLDIHPDWKYTLLIPDFETSTQEARKVLPLTYPRDVVVENIAHASLMIEALRQKDFPLLQIAAIDKIHEPYRKQLIHEFDAVQNIIDNEGVLFISGSGSTCLLISKDPLALEKKAKIHTLQHNWNIIEVALAKKGTEVIL